MDAQVLREIMMLSVNGNKIFSKIKGESSAHVSTK